MNEHARAARIGLQDVLGVARMLVRRDNVHSRRQRPLTPT